MKIIFIVSNLKNIGGIQNYNKNLLEAMRNFGQRVEIVELEHPDFFSKIIFVVNFFTKIIIFKPNFIFCSHINFSPIVYLFKKIFNYDYIIFTYGVDAWNIRGNFKIKALKSAKIVVSISRYTSQKLREQISEIGNKIFLLPNAIDGEKFYPKEKSTELLKKYDLIDKKLILTVTRLSAEEQMKGYDKIIMGLPNVIKEIPEVRYLLIGEGTDALRIKKLIKELGLEDYVIMSSPIPLNSPLLVDYYNICDFYVMPSVSEGFGIVFLEALACGKPVIAGNKDGSRDAILDGELGILVNPNDIDEIAETIIKALKKEVPKNILDGNYLRRRVLEVYGFDKFKEKVKNLIYELQR